MELSHRDARLALPADAVVLGEVLARQASSRAGLDALGHLEHLPELKVFVAARRDDRHPVWTERRMQDATLMRIRDLGDLAERGVGPQGDVVVGHAVRREELLRVRIPDERGDLRVGDEAVEARGLCRVPEVDRLVGRAAAGSEEGRVPGAPSEGLRDLQVSSG